MSPLSTSPNLRRPTRDSLQGWRLRAAAHELLLNIGCCRSEPADSGGIPTRSMNERSGSTKWSRLFDSSIISWSNQEVSHKCDKQSRLYSELLLNWYSRELTLQNLELVQLLEEVKC